MRERTGTVVVSSQEDSPPPEDALVERMASMPFIVIMLAPGKVDPAWQRLADVVLEPHDDSLADILANVDSCPLACTSLALLLRGQPGRTAAEGLAAESAVYSVMQSGPEFAAWRATRSVRARAAGDDQPRVRVERRADTLSVTLTRPDRLNALDARMRDELSDVLAIAVADPGIDRIELRGEGRAFCAGGDLDEFGTRADPATAHLIRLQRSVSRTLHELADRTTAFVHGPCAGSGIELAAFAGRVVAAPDTSISMPEVRLGLIPGAGGTVSLTRRIGRFRTAWLALSGRAIDATTARLWGLVDEVGAEPNV